MFGSRGIRRAWVLFAGLGSVSCADTRPTALVLAISEDNEVEGRMDSVDIIVERGGAEQFSQTYVLPSEARLPGTLTLQKNEDRKASEPILIRVVGHDSSKPASDPLIERRARIGFVDEHTKLLRMPLRGDCIGKKCDANQTCDLGVCVSSVIDATTLPDFVSTNDAIANGASGSDGIGGTAGDAGSSGSTGAAGTSGAAGSNGTAGEGGTGGIGGTSGASGTNGTSGVGGTAGTSGTSGSAGSSGAAGSSGTAGTSGSAGASGTAGTASTTLEDCGDMTGLQSGAPWPMYGYCPTHTHRSPYASTQHPAVRWKIDLSGMDADGSAVIDADGTVYIGADDGLRAINGQTGDVLWKSDMAMYGGIQSTPAIAADGTLVVGTGTGDVLFIDRHTQEILHAKSTNQIVTASPVIAPDGRAFVGSTNGTFYAFTPDGEIAWSEPTSSSFDSASPVISQAGRVFVENTHAEILSRDLQGNSFWTNAASTTGTLAKAPSVGPTGDLWVPTGQTVLQVDPLTGATLGTFTANDTIKTTPVVGKNGLIYAGSADFKLHAFDATTKIDSWAFTSDGTVDSTPALDVNGLVIFGTYGGVLFALDGDTGALAWQRQLGGRISDAPAIDQDGAIYVGTHGWIYGIGPLDPARCTAFSDSGKDYLLCKNLARTWEEAVDLCASAGSQIAVLATVAEINAITSQLTALDAGDWWIGASDLAAEGTFKWIDGSAVTGNPWASNEPDNGGSGNAENCVALNATTGLFSDEQCVLDHPFVCEHP